jgi:hypothetical protein
MLIFDDSSKKQLIELYENKNIILEGNIVKLIDYSDDVDFEKYIKTSIEKDRETRRRRLDITKKVQQQNKELSDLNVENERIMSELKSTLESVEIIKNQIESQNKELIDWKKENEKLTIDLQNEMLNSDRARIEAENAKKNVENDLDLLQKKTQFQLMNTIVRVALFVIIGVGIITTGLYLAAIFFNKDTQIIGSTWSNMFGILLTNAFSIVGTIMGVKYASDRSDS